jgi:mRNA-degrading endonuclease RelE of RelBE toxin-antitoxin system
MQVVIDEQVENFIEYMALMAQREATRVTVRIAELGLDPFPSDTVVKSMEVRLFTGMGLAVRRLKSLEFQKYRIFYLVDNPHDTVYVMHIVDRDMYDYENSPATNQAIAKKYRAYYGEKRWLT